ncbi:SAM-dependent methyltransferase [Piscinibacter sakaiensis]|uniref:SAM-dependent methyltransferase n=1 Tax=Piscinibacter sakaiensis TaxID=1547922 RepID=UPI003AAA62D2
MSATPHGRLYLMPNTLDFGLADNQPRLPLEELLPIGVIRIASTLTCWVCENAKTTRALLKRVDALVPLATPLQSLAIVEMPRPQKGGPARAAISGERWNELLAPALAGRDLGLLSEAGLPAVADPGAGLVQAAHDKGIEVVALPGASSLLLALAASGMQGQHFAFVGYLPVAATERTARIRELEAASRRAGQSQLMIETPYRNQALLAALLAALQPTTRLAVSCGLSMPGGFSRSASVATWRQRDWTLPADMPAVFSLLAGS